MDTLHGAEKWMYDSLDSRSGWGGGGGVLCHIRCPDEFKFFNFTKIFHRVSLKRSPKRTWYYCIRCIQHFPPNNPSLTGALVPTRPLSLPPPFPPALCLSVYLPVCLFISPIPYDTQTLGPRCAPTGGRGLPLSEIPLCPGRFVLRGTCGGPPNRARSRHNVRTALSAFGALGGVSGVWLRGEEAILEGDHAVIDCARGRLRLD